MSNTNTQQEDASPKKSWSCISCPKNCDTTPAKAKIAKPFPYKVKLEKNKTYRYCTCGFSQTQPFCDDTCKNNAELKNWEPLEFQVHVDQTWWSLCACKRTGAAPWCDGKHISIDDW